ncbi:DUF4405 domain-containing protein [Celeribacter arenosi]|uniref:Flavinylation-associated cytochrome domain-containing protein n=1 Tax=Celeribacter arenosi TaxID=792649 RepID=A0ABP7K5G1_9RHOB
MSTLRKFATPLTIGTFLVVGVTGVLWYFHIITDAGRWLHEIVGLAMVAVVGLHLTLNWRAFVTYFKRPLALGIMALFAAVTVGGYMLPDTRAQGEGGMGRAGFAAVTQIGEAEIATLAPVFHLSVDEAVARAVAAGYVDATAQSTPAGLAGSSDTRAVMGAIEAISGN